MIMVRKKIPSCCGECPEKDECSDIRVCPYIFDPDFWHWG